MAESRDNHLRAKLIATFVLAAVLSLLHWTIWIVLTSTVGLNEYEVVTLLRIGNFGIDLTALHSAGPAFGWAAEHEAFRRAVYAFSAALLFIIVACALSLVASKYKTQIVVLELFGASAIALNLEKLVTGLERSYVYLYFNAYQLPGFNVYDLVVNSALVLLYVFVLLRFFRLLPSFRPTRQLEGVVGQLSDPFYEKRTRLRVMLSVMIVLGALVVVSNGVMAFADVKEIVGLVGVVTFVAISMLLSGVIALGPLVLLWRVLPTRPVDVIYLRSFRLDRRGWRTVRCLRRGLGRQRRLAGVVDPNESRRWYYLLFWLLSPFMFALGDLGRVNVTRHNMFLEGNWKEGVKIAFSGTGSAVFDCRTLTESLLWEIGTGLEMLGPRVMFFIIPDESSPAFFQASLAASGLAEVTLRRIPADNIVHESQTITLAGRIRALPVAD